MSIHVLFESFWGEIFENKTSYNRTSSTKITKFFLQTIL
jgi:hypothetical protein